MAYTNVRTVNNPSSVTFENIVDAAKQADGDIDHVIFPGAIAVAPETMAYCQRANGL
jgi:hypothetical protein